MASPRNPASTRWALLLLLVPLLVTFGTYGDSVLAPLGWIGAVVLLAAVFIAVMRSSRRRRPAFDSR